MERFAGGAISVICGSMLVKGEQDLDKLKWAVNEIYRLNDALRIRIRQEDGQASQHVTDYAPRDVEVLRFDSKAELDAYAEEYAKTPIDLYGDLCNISLVLLPGQYGVLVKFHHMVGDAWTIALIGTQFNKLMNGETVESFSYADYVESEQAYLQSSRYEKDRAFFLEQFQKCDEVTYLNEKQSDTRNACRRTFVVNSQQTKQIVDYAKENGTSAFVLFTAALATYMSRTKMNAEKFYIGTAVLNRSGVKEKNTMGMFVNTVPMLMELDNSKSFAENLDGVQKTAFSIFRHQKHNYGDVLAAIRKEYGFSETLYDVMISYQNAAIAGADVETTWYFSGTQTESLVLNIDDRDNNGALKLHYDYLTDKFTESEINTMHQHICNLLFDAISNHTKKLYELKLLSDCEKRTLIHAFNDTTVDFPNSTCVQQLFEEQVERTPSKTALVFEGKVYTYKQLDEMSNSLANYLISIGVTKEEPIPILAKRSEYVIIAMLGIVKAGATYVPMDFSWPKNRLAHILEELNAKIVLAYDRYDLYGIKIIKLDEFDYWSHTERSGLKNQPDDLMYIIYTSGSTGTPKGTKIRHRNVVNYCFNSEKNHMINTLKCEYNCKSIVSINNICFDAFLDESFLPLLNGLTVFLANQEQTVDCNKFLELVNANSVDVVSTTPTKFKILTNGTPCSIKHIIFGGETLKDTDLSYANSITNGLVYNTYGPTETTCGSTYTQIDNALDVHIGKPIANTQIYIVDQYLQPTPIGITGELCIAGDGVGAGYLNRPELTAEKFIDNPFGKGKLYKTGDLAYWREDGNIVYVGRNDFQVKIRGLRIELGEIEHAICGMEGISQAVVVVRKNSQGRQLICAFYVGAETDAKDIRTHIGKKLPKYMLPHICTRIEEMPLTSSGKVNRKALPEVDLENIKNDTEFVPPETERQRELCRLLEVVLGTAPVGIEDDFFDLGGDSLKAIEFVSKAHNEGIYFDLQGVFDHPTVKGLCEHLENGDKQEISFADVDFTAANTVLEKNRVEYITTPNKTAVGNILLAGATGYLGIHVLANFLDQDTGTAYCLVRGKDQQDSNRRLQELLQFYFGDKYADTERIEVVCADLQKDGFALPDTAYTQLAGKVDTVINCAASVKHYGSYKYFYEVNVEATKRLIAFCERANAKLIHTSTVAVSGNSFNNDLFTDERDFQECDLYIGQPLENVYARSKFEAERAVIEAMAHGLQANIMRMGNLMNRASDGVFQKNYQTNAFLKRVRAMMELGAYPESLAGHEVEFTPIDEAAQAIMTLTRHFSAEQNVFHLNNGNYLALETLFGYLRTIGYDMKQLADEEFDVCFKVSAQQEGKEYILDAFINDLDQSAQLNYHSNIQLRNDFTVQYLKALGFEWSEIGLDYVRKYVGYFRKIKYFR